DVTGDGILDLVTADYSGRGGGFCRVAHGEPRAIAGGGLPRAPDSRTAQPVDVGRGHAVTCSDAVMVTARVSRRGGHLERPPFRRRGLLPADFTRHLVVREHGEHVGL